MKLTLNITHYYRLIVIADKRKVDAEFPIPLINRLEKHYMSSTSLLNDSQKRVANRLKEWADKFVTPRQGYESINSMRVLII